jgi:5-methylcytosine-specific restriction endonuclease McrA
MSKSYISPSLRRRVSDRANHSCEYCLIPEALSLSSHHVDHIIAETKGSDIASIDPNTAETVRLYNPRKDIWTEHFTLEVATGLIQPQTAIGRVTAKLLRINRLESLPVRQLLAKIGYIPSKKT